MTYTVGSVPYLNAKPLVRMFEDLGEASPVEVVYDVPSKLPGLLADRKVQAIMVSSIEALRAPAARVAGGVCIGSRREVLSVRLFSKIPPDQIQRLALDQSSMTSNALAQIILKERYGATPRCTPCPPDLQLMLLDHDACVLIGDNGMREQGSGLQILDLGLEWFLLKGLPFVWAVWLGDAGLDSSLAGHLVEAERYGQANMDKVIADAPGPTGIAPDLCRRYFREIMHYGMGEAELAALREFGQSAVRLGLLNEAHFPQIVSPPTASGDSEPRPPSRREVL